MHFQTAYYSYWWYEHQTIWNARSLAFTLDAGEFTLPYSPTTVAGNVGQYDALLDNINFTFTAVPEPTMMLAGALLLIPFAMSALRMLRKHRRA